MKKQVVVIHGGDTFDTYEEWFEYLKKKPLNFERIKSPQGDWKDGLGEKLGSDFEMVFPQMPNKQNAKYAEWKIWFETIIPYLEPEVMLIGHSLGGIFIPKYLSENKFPKTIRATFLVAAPYDDKDSEYTLGDFALPSDVSGFERQGGKIFMYQSEDDPMVPFSDFLKYQKVLPAATFRTFKDRAHFDQKEFPEIVEDIKGAA